jgi:nucleoside-diphosphate-sugar epimerase
MNHWESWTVARRLLDREPYVLQDDGQQLCTAMHAADFARVFLGLWGNPAAMNEAFQITSSEYLTWRQVAELTAEALGVTPEFCFVPAQELYLELHESWREKVMHTASHAVYDSTKVRKAVLESAPAIRFADGIKQTIQFYLDHPEYQKVSADWDAAFDRIVEKYHG